MFKKRETATEASIRRYREGIPKLHEAKAAAKACGDFAHAAELQSQIERDASHIVHLRRRKLEEDHGVFDGPHADKSF